MGNGRGCQRGCKSSVSFDSSGFIQPPPREIYNHKRSKQSEFNFPNHEKSQNDRYVYLSMLPNRIHLTPTLDIHL